MIKLHFVENDCVVGPFFFIFFTTFNITQFGLLMTLEFNFAAFGLVRQSFSQNRTMVDELRTEFRFCMELNRELNIK